ncbi:MAG: hypothetical protein IJ659_04170 [Alloprevotella sp.]|nr:hypothetical protein [Alloprevotella sp.]
MKRIPALLFAAVLLFAAQPVSAQAYGIELTNQTTHWEAKTSEVVKFKADKGVSFRAISRNEYTVILSFYLYDLSANGTKLLAIDIDPKGSGDVKGTVQLHLSNGEVLTSNEASSLSLSIYVGAQTLRGTKNPNLRNNGGDAMALLRRYDITQIVVNGRVFTTPGFRSAATYDAMCRSLMAKTGDQGQYGTAAVSQPAQSAAVSQPAAPNRAPVQMPVVTSKRMTLRQMLQRPFGVFPENCWEITFADAEENLRNYPGWTTDVYRDATNASITLSFTKGYDMTLGGDIPATASCFWQNGRLKTFSYTFQLNKDVYDRQAAVRFAQTLERDIVNSEHVSFVGKPDFLPTYYFYLSEAAYSGRVITISLTDGSLPNTYKVQVSISQPNQ